MNKLLSSKVLVLSILALIVGESRGMEQLEFTSPNSTGQYGSVLCNAGDQNSNLQDGIARMNKRLEGWTWRKSPSWKWLTKKGIGSYSLDQLKPLTIMAIMLGGSRIHIDRDALRLKVILIKFLDENWVALSPFMEGALQWLSKQGWPEQIPQIVCQGFPQGQQFVQPQPKPQPMQQQTVQPQPKPQPMQQQTVQPQPAQISQTQQPQQTQGNVTPPATSHNSDDELFFDNSLENYPSDDDSYEGIFMDF